MRNRKVWTAVGILVVVGLIGGVVGVTVLRSGSGDDPADTARLYIDAWRRADVGALGRLTTGPVAKVRATYEAQARDLGAWPSSVRLVRVAHTGDAAGARYEATFSFGPHRTWSYRGELPMHHTSDGWAVQWRPTNVYPGLAADQHFRLTRAFAPRAPILAEDGTPLTVAGSVITIGIEPQRMNSREEVSAALGTNLGIDPALVNQKLDAPGVQPDYFVPIVTVPEATYQSVKAKIYDVHGLLFRRSTQRQAATPQLGAHAVGAVGPITKEILDELGEPYRDTDEVGRSGLERRYERRLAGTPSLTIELVDGAGAATPVTTLPGADPQPVRTTLDLPTQMRAEAAVGTTAPAALVAIRPSDGAVRAVVSTPITEEFDRALDGAYPPGSTFKVVTTAALLAHGTTPDTPATCPPSVTINGRDFVNFEGETEPTLTFRRAFAISCNTAFIGLAQQLPVDALAVASTWFGFGATPDLGLAAKGGTYPTPAGETERAASAIGQARVTASPLAMAGVAGTVAAGTWHAPSLVLDPAPTITTPAGTALDATIQADLSSLMHEVVERGTGTAAAIAGQDIAGKTGTAEFGGDTPPKTHAWFIGFRGDLAFAVIVEGGGVGGRVAAPIAHAFLAAG